MFKKTHLLSSTGIATALIALILVILTIPTLVSAQSIELTSTSDAGGTYQLLEPTPFEAIIDVNNLTFCSYIAGVFKILIMLAGMLAVLQIMFAGFQFMINSDSPGKRSDAKDRFMGALLGLIIALVAWILLATLNESLVDFCAIEETASSDSPVAVTVADSEPSCGIDLSYDYIITQVTDEDTDLSGQISAGITVTDADGASAADVIISPTDVSTLYAHTVTVLLTLDTDDTHCVAKRTIIVLSPCVYYTHTEGTTCDADNVLCIGDADPDSCTATASSGGGGGDSDDDTTTDGTCCTPDCFEDIADDYGTCYPSPCEDSATTALVTCITSDPTVASMLDTSQVYTYEQDNEVCNYTRGEEICGDCAHSVDSCHYGGTSGDTGALAVDFNVDTTTTYTEWDLYNAIAAVACSCGATQLIFESSHTHVSVDGCDKTYSSATLTCP